MAFHLQLYPLPLKAIWKLGVELTILFAASPNTVRDPNFSRRSAVT
jgi:hypothetical protein